MKKNEIEQKRTPPPFIKVQYHGGSVGGGGALFVPFFEKYLNLALRRLQQNFPRFSPSDITPIFLSFPCFTPNILIRNIYTFMASYTNLKYTEIIIFQTLIILQITKIKGIVNNLIFKLKKIIRIRANPPFCFYSFLSAIFQIILIFHKNGTKEPPPHASTMMSN